MRGTVVCILSASSLACKRLGVSMAVVRNHFLPVPVCWGFGFHSAARCHLVVLVSV